MSHFSRWYYLCILTCLSLVPMTSRAQNTSLSAVELGTPTSSTKSLIEAESKIQTGVPGFLDNLLEAQSLLKKNQWEDSLASIEQAKQEVEGVFGALKGYDYQELELSLRNIDQNLREASYALKARRKVEANREIGEAYKLTKALADSPVMKLSAAKVSLGAANQEILNRNYANAGILLQRSIDDLTAVENSPNVDQSAIRSLKSDIVVAHQQLTLGKMQKPSYMSQLYDRASAATSNSFYQYYDMWTRTNLPWDQY